MPDDDHRLAAAVDRLDHVGSRCARSESFVCRGLDAGRPPELIGGLAGAEQWAREDRVGLDSLRREQLAERSRVAPAFRREGSELVGLTRSRVRVADEVEAHAPEDTSPGLSWAGFLESRRDGWYVLYSLRRDRLAALSAELLGYVDSGHS